MEAPKLVMHIPGGFVTATSLGVSGFAQHRSPGSGKYFQGRAVLVELALGADGNPAFEFLDEGGWRDAKGDTLAALEAARAGKRTKTALSNTAFNCIPLTAWQKAWLLKTGGDVLEMAAPIEIAKYPQADCCEKAMTPDDIAAAAGLARPAARQPRLYMTLAPIEMLVYSNLNPEEFVFYTTRRPGKRFRQVAFVELQSDPGVMIAAELKIEAALKEVSADSKKKTKTIVVGDTLGRVPYRAWVGYDRKERGGLYVGWAGALRLWQFPEKIPRHWDNAW